MMKNKLKYIAFLLLLFSCSDTKIIDLKTDLDKLRLKGQVKQIQKSAWEVKMAFGELVRLKPKIGPPIEPVGYYDDYFRELHFNDEGNIKKSVWLDENNLVVSSLDHYYDKHARIIKVEDHKKNNTEITIYDDLNFTSTTTKKYLNQDFPWEGEFKYYYDTNNNIIKEELYEKQKLKYRYLILYTEKGKQYSKEEYTNWNDENAQGKLTGYQLYGYDENANLISSLDSISKYKSIQNSLINYAYNKQGDVIEYHTPRDKYWQFTSTSYTYKYDAQNNWIERIEHIGTGTYKIPSVLTIRKIEYY